MNGEVEGIIREAAAATQMARLHGCVVDIHVRRSFGRFVRVVIDPNRTASLVTQDGHDPIGQDTEPMKALTPETD